MNTKQNTNPMLERLKAGSRKQFIQKEIAKNPELLGNEVELGKLFDKWFAKHVGVMPLGL